MHDIGILTQQSIAAIIPVMKAATDLQAASTCMQLAEACQL